MRKFSYHQSLLLRGFEGQLSLLRAGPRTKGQPGGLSASSGGSKADSDGQAGGSEGQAGGSEGQAGGCEGQAGGSTD